MGGRHRRDKHSSCRLRSSLPRLRLFLCSFEQAGARSRARMILIRHGQTEFNRIFSVTRTDPGIRDPQLTQTGRIQAAAVAGALHGLNICRLICSPYIRALETAEIISARLRLPIAAEALVAERCVFACDVGSELGDLRRRWPHLTFDHLADPWWPQQEETEEVLLQRSETFCGRMAADNSFEVAVVT